MSLGPFRPALLAPLAWVGVAALWIWSFHRPWTDAGTLSLSTFADAFVVLRGGAADDVVPSGAALFVLALPVLGVVLLVVAGLRTVTMSVTRAALAAVGVAVVVIAIRMVPDDGAGLGPGAKTAVAGAVIAVLAVVLDVVGDAVESRRSEGRSLPSEVVPGLIAGMLCLVLGLAGAVGVGIQAAQHRTGADRPIQAVRDLVAALMERDGVAVLGLVAPDERDDVVAAFLRLEEQMGGGGDSDGLTDAVTFDVDPDDLEFELLGSTGLTATVRLTSGRYAVGVDFDALPAGFRVLEVLFDDGVWAGDAGADQDEGPLSLFLDGPLEVPVRQIDDRWYVTGLADALDHVSDVLVGEERPDFDELPQLLLERLQDRLVGSLADRLGLD